MINALVSQLLKSLKNYSVSLKNTNNISNRKWISNDINGLLCTYRFQLDGRILVGINGNGVYWQYQFTYPNSLVITDADNKITILNHGYIFDGILSLQKEGTDERILFYDEEIIPDGNVTEYIKRELIKKLQIRPIRTNSMVWYIPETGITLGKPIYNENLQLIDPGKIIIGDWGYEINRENLISSSYKPIVLKSNNGELIVMTETGTTSEDQRVYFRESEIKPHGIYHIEDDRRIMSVTIIYGVIRSINEHKESWLQEKIKDYIFPTLLISLIIIFTIIALYYYLSIK